MPDLGTRQLSQTLSRNRNWHSWLDRQQLRAHARLDTQSADRLIPWFLALLLFSVLEWLALARYNGFDHGLQLASAIQSSWLIGEGYLPESSLLGESFLATQASFLIYPIALIAGVFTTAEALLTMQAIILAVGLVPLWQLARHEALLGVGTSLALAFAYSVSAGVHSLNLTGFHVETVAIPALLALVLHTRLRRRHPSSQSEPGTPTHPASAPSSTGTTFSFVKRWWSRAPLEREKLGKADLAWVWFLVVVVLLSRADLGLVVAAYGVLVVFEGRKLLGWLLALIGSVWLMLVVWVIQPSLAGGQYLYAQFFADYGRANPWSVFWGMLTQPGNFLQDLLTQQNFTAVVMLLAPLVFLPLVAYRYLLPVAPLYVLYLTADSPTDQLSDAAHNIPVIAFVFVAAVFALRRSGQVLVERVRVNRYVVFALALAAAVFFVSDSLTSPYNSPWNWQERQTQEVAYLQAARAVPEAAVVRASPAFLPMLAERVGALELDTAGTQAREAAERAMVGSDWILLDTAEAPWGEELLEVQLFATVLRQSGYELKLNQASTMVFEYTG